MSDKKVVTLDNANTALHEQRKKRANRRLITYLSIFFFLILLVVYFQSPLSHVRNIQVAGEQYVQAEEIEKASNVKKGTSIWNVDMTQAEERVREFSEIENVNIQRSLPATISIEVEEYPRIAYVKNGDEYLPVLRNGKTLQNAARASVPGDAPVLSGFSSLEILEEFSAELGEVGEGILNRISEVHHVPDDEDPLRLLMYMNDGLQVESTIRNFSDHMTPYPVVAKEIDPEAAGVLHMKMTPYFEAFEEEAEMSDEGLEETVEEGTGEVEEGNEEEE
ncbi:cell division protein FtsQ/DivIB [Bacillus sp. FJAT-44742]|uniref:cell division protein FtsQ/DivIB n=1 Tax=Bacillus sp. FJAT-44742 TaxID=2014005 RepID=UPI000C2383F7|nr:FtsQ-type POTRA domain-containing protein [Bacillus sp. FJAT-44742]